jgi:hypothetical protein
MSRTIHHVVPTVIGLSLLSLAIPAAHGQGRSMNRGPFMTPNVMAAPSRFTMPAMMPTQFPMTSSVSMNLTPNTFVRRDRRLDDLFPSMMGLGTFGPLGALPPIVVPVGGPLVGSGGGSIPAAAPRDAARAALLEEKAFVERLANRRRAFDELAYERENTPSPEQALLARSRTNPPPAEVFSGQALNALLADLVQLGAAIDELDRPDISLPLDLKELRHINLTQGTGNIALLKGEGRLTWPAVLAGAAFRAPRERLALLAPEAVRQASRNGRVDLAVIGQMTEDAGQLRALLRQQAQSLSYEPFAEAKAFIQGFGAAIVALQQPDVARHFDGAYDLKAQTVLGLVKQMTDGGLRFAPAAPGDETAYAALREALAACDRAAIQQKAER